MTRGIDTGRGLCAAARSLAVVDRAVEWRKYLVDLLRSSAEAFSCAEKVFR